MTIVSNIVESLTDQERLQILADHSEYENDGFIGECLLRSTAVRAMDAYGADGSITRMMEQVAFETYRHFANRFIAEKLNA